MKASFSGIFWGFVCLGIGCFFLAGTWGVYLDYNRVQDYSGQASGQVTKKHVQTAADGSGNYFLDYCFVPANGSKINATGSISKQQWDALQVDDTLEIRYDPSNTDSSIPLYGESPSLIVAFFMMIMGAVFLIFGALRFIASFKKG